jgi:DNA polymerase-4
MLQCYVDAREILHCDINNFFAGVEVILNPELRGKAIAVCGAPEKRHGIVLAKSEPAKKCGVKTGMPIWQAKQLCPEVIIVLPRHHEYDKYSKTVSRIYYGYTDLVEAFGCDECWLDITNTPAMRRLGSAKAVADEIRETIKREVGLTISVGVSWNKTFAKLGSDMKKPDATTVISRENYQSLVWPLPVCDMLFIGKKTAAVLMKLNIKTIGDLARADAEMLRGHFGINAYRMVAACRGDDSDSVQSFDYRRAPKSVGNGTTLFRDLVTTTDIEQVLYLLTEEVAYRLRKKGYKGTTVNLSVRGKDLTWTGAQETVREATNASKTIFETAKRIFAKIWGAAPAMSLRVSVSNLTRDTRTQMTMFDAQNEVKNDVLSGVFDTIRRKYGTKSIKFAYGNTGDFDLNFEVVDE